jgi:hypothetical protein
MKKFLMFVFSCLVVVLLVGLVGKTFNWSFIAQESSSNPWHKTSSSDEDNTSTVPIEILPPEDLYEYRDNFLFNLDTFVIEMVDANSTFTLNNFTPKMYILNDDDYDGEIDYYFYGGDRFDFEGFGSFFPLKNYLSYYYHEVSIDDYQGLKPGDIINFRLNFSRKNVNNFIKFYVYFKLGSISNMLKNYLLLKDIKYFEYNSLNNINYDWLDTFEPFDFGIEPYKYCLADIFSEDLFHPLINFSYGDNVDLEFTFVFYPQFMSLNTVNNYFPNMVEEYYQKLEQEFIDTGRDFANSPYMFDDGTGTLKDRLINDYLYWIYECVNYHNADEDWLWDYHEEFYDVFCEYVSISTIGESLYFLAAKQFLQLVLDFNLVFYSLIGFYSLIDSLIVLKDNPNSVFEIDFNLLFRLSVNFFGAY